jgi:type I restriction enzyme M protein|tara:strand:- start:20421 stop:24497 length:4077 start_codon:yes stop_codon:yes gene_type:complete
VAEVSSHNAIWQMLDRVRANSPISNSEFGVALAALIFLRWADFEEAEREAIAAFDDVDYEPVLSTKFHWRSWCNVQNPGELEHIFRELPSALDRFANSRHDAMATQLHRVAPAVEKLSRFPADTLAHLIHWLADQPFETPADRIAVRDIFDELLRKSGDRWAGQFFTPKPVVELMVALSEPKFGESIYDPCFGSAGLLTESFDYVRGHQPTEVRSGRPPLNIAGVEINPDSFVIGLTRLVLSGVTDPQLEFGNSLERVPSNNPSADGFDVVIANPPWGGKVSDDYGLRHYPIQSKDTVTLFIQHAISQLRPGGRAILAVPPGNLFRGGREQALRQMLIEEHTVDAVVALPAGVFQPHTSIPSCLLMLRKGGTTKSVRMVDLSSDKKMQPTKVGVFHSQDEIVNLVRDPHASRFTWDVDVETLAELDFDLTPKKRNQSELSSLLSELPDDIEIQPLQDCCKITAGRSIPSRDLLDVPSVDDEGLVPVAEISAEIAQLQARVNELNDNEPGQHHERLSLLKRMEALTEDLEYREYAESYEIPYIRIRDVANGVAAAGTAWVKREAAKGIAPKWKLKHGDVLVSKSGTIGKTGIVRNGAVGGIAANSFFVLRVDGDVLDPHFVMAYLNSSEVRFWLEERARGSAAKHLSSAVFKEIPIPLPPIQMQRRIGAEYRELGTDAIELLSRLLTGTETNAVSQWLNHYWATLSNQDVDSLGISYWQKLSGEFRKLRNEVAHSTSDAGPLTAWTLAFSEALTPFRGAEDIPDGPALFSVLNEVGRRLDRAEEAADGDLPDNRKAKSFTRVLEKWLKLTTESMVKQSRLVITTDVTEVPVGECTDLTLKVENQGTLPIRSLRLWGEPFNDVHIQFLAAGDSAEAEFSVVALEEYNHVDVTIQWECLSLEGDEISGSKDLRFSVVSAESASETADLGASPYVTGDPVKVDRNDVFFGREELIEQIKRQVLQSGNVVLLEGNRRAGKSSVLWHLEGAKAIPGWLGVYCSLQGAEGNSEGGIPTADVFRSIAYELVQSMRKLNGSVVMPDGTVLDGDKKLGIARALQQGISEEAPFQDFREYLETIIETLAEQQLGLLLMIDEFDKLQEGINNKVTSPQVPENIRFLVQSFPKLSAILTGSRRLKRMRQEYWSALFGLGTRLGVSALPLEAAARLITEPVAGRLSYSKSAVNRAHELTAGQPYLLQCLCNRVFDIAARTGVRSITVDHVNDAADALVEDNEHFASLWDYTEFDRRRFLLYLLHREENGPDPMRLGVIEAKLEEAGVELREEIVISDLELLRELELVDLHGESSGAYYTLTIPMMGQWLDSQQDFEILRSRARAEAEDISGKLSEITRPEDEIEDTKDIDDE